MRMVDYSANEESQTEKENPFITPMAGKLTESHRLPNDGPKMILLLNKRWRYKSR